LSFQTNTNKPVVFRTYQQIELYVPYRAHDDELLLYVDYLHLTNTQGC